MKLASFTATGVNQPAAGRFTADRIDATDLEGRRNDGTQGDLRMTYQAPRIEVTDYVGPSAPAAPA